MTTTGTRSARRFELQEGPSSKFWQICVDDAEVTVQFGRLGATGQTQVKSFPDAAAATQHAAKLITDKTGKGYQEVN